MTDGPRAVIRLDALRHNFAVLKSQAPEARVIAPVKANAYGHGLVRVAQELAGADCLAVARLGEAEALRASGVSSSILLLAGVVNAQGLDRAAELRCSLVVHTDAQVALLEKGGASIERVWLKVDTGMRRLGVMPDQVPPLIARLEACAAVGQVGLMTHLANADVPGDPHTRAQLDVFRDLAQQFDGEVSVANSALTLTGLGEFAAWIRPGISLYGVSPFADRDAPELRPVMQLETCLLDVKAIREGDAVGYGGRWRAPSDTLLGIAAIGYGDGYSRHLPSATPALVNGRRVGVAGRVSMDLMALDLGSGAQDEIGDAVVLWGDALPVEEIAGCGDTIPYALLTGVADRVPRVYR